MDQLDSEWQYVHPNLNEILLRIFKFLLLVVYIHVYQWIPVPCARFEVSIRGLHHITPQTLVFVIQEDQDVAPL